MAPSIGRMTRQRGNFWTADDDRAKSAMIPPSPLLSARMISRTYFRETTIISDHRMAEMPPRIVPVSRTIPWEGLNTSLAAYRGLVPISP